ncbi:unnamed protein product [Adineta steineri]|uniref:nicotinamidase n=1 Tax=Adineta steineri TaxID=433720 RepID=A0A814MF25_9BILA|nr:unnamed protein product [Adineta steineri]CAF4018046.1 unnamed protein product [Adineta steineri]
MKFLQTIRLWILFIIIQIYTIQSNTQKVDDSSNNVYALLVIDVQYCFINGSLALKNSPARQDGAEVIPIINKLIKTVPFDVVAYSLDWHPKNHISFINNTIYRNQYILNGQYQDYKIGDTITYTGPESRTDQVLWPAHCVQNTDEAELSDDLIHYPADDKYVYVVKGTDPDIDSYSAFYDNNKLHMTPLNDELKKRNVTHVFVAGLALDFCVGSTAVDAADLKYKTYVIKDASRGVNDKTIKTKLIEMKQHGVKIIEADDVENIVKHDQHNKRKFINFQRRKQMYNLLQRILENK